MPCGTRPRRAGHPSTDLGQPARPASQRSQGIFTRARNHNQANGANASNLPKHMKRRTPLWPAVRFPLFVWRKRTKLSRAVAGQLPRMPCHGAMVRIFRALYGNKRRVMLIDDRWVLQGLEVSLRLLRLTGWLGGGRLGWDPISSRKPQLGESVETGKVLGPALLWRGMEQRTSRSLLEFEESCELMCCKGSCGDGEDGEDCRLGSAVSCSFAEHRYV